MLPSIILVLFTLLPFSQNPVPVSGRVVDPEGRPVDRALVLIVPGKGLEIEACRKDLKGTRCYESLSQQRLLDGEALTGSNGRFTIPISGGLTSDDYILVKGKDQSGANVANAWPIGSNRNISSPDLGIIELNRWRDLLILVRSDGRPVPDAELEFGFGESQRTDKHGEARFGFYAEGEENTWHVAFIVRAKGFAVEARSYGLRAGSAIMTVDLVNDVALDGRVFAPDGTPVSKAVVTVRPEEYWDIDPTSPRDDQVTQVLTNETGRFTVRGLRQDREYRLSVEAPAQLAVVRADLTVRGGDKPLEVRLARAGEVLVEGEFPPGAAAYSNRALLELVEANRPAGPIQLERLNPATGDWEVSHSILHVEEVRPGFFRIRFTQVPAGLARITVNGWSGVADDTSTSFTVTAGISTPMSIRLVMARTLRLQVVDSKGSLLSGASVEWQLPQANSTSSQNADDSGRLEIKVHPLRDLQIKVTTTDGRETHMSIPAGTTSEPYIINLPAE